ncbi:hypothetical protein WR25_01451 [Diploscapter pachys]|uniref:G-protein coupled receptors family 1 profile domain-containing protein n=1 Tax=Diploscapter pachys TaxID=2018661 RepID=A0A2A2KJA5_9BILA|nr:hypothetical protein WR25_01451 [Diploscapter pachys]
MWMSQIDADGHYSLFITPLHYYQTYIGCIISVLTNGTLVYIILSRPHRKMGNYKYVVLAFVCFDILYSLLDVIIKPALYTYKQAFVLLSSGGLLSYPPPIGVFGICFWTCVTFTLMIYWGYKSQKALSKFDTMLSSSTRALQKSLLKALVIQTMVPLFFAYIPCWIVFSLPLMPFEVSKVITNNVMITAVTLFPICDCIVIIYYVKAFRDTLIEILGNIPCLNGWIARIRSDSRSTRSNKVHNSSQSNNKQCSTQMT